MLVQKRAKIIHLAKRHASLPGNVIRGDDVEEEFWAVRSSACSHACYLNRLAVRSIKGRHGTELLLAAVDVEGLFGRRVIGIVGRGWHDGRVAVYRCDSYSVKIVELVGFVWADGFLHGRMQRPHSGNRPDRTGSHDPAELVIRGMQDDRYVSLVHNTRLTS